MNNAPIQSGFETFAFDPLSAGIGLGLGLLLGGGAVALVMGAKLAASSREAAGLSARLESERAALGDHFKALAQSALQSNNEQFLSLAGERLKAQAAQGANDLDKRTVEIEKLVKPIEKELVRLNTLSEQMQGTDKALRENLLSLQRETSKLTGVLRNPSAQGRWGEFVLETILDKANLIKGVHYSTQEQIEGGRRPDVIINLHDGFRIAIDSKAPINEFVARLDDDISKEDAEDIQNNMAKAVRAHVKALGAKTYQENVGGSDFVILFLPSEVVFSATLRADPDIVDYASENHVVIASPTLIISLLRVVGLSWRQVEMAKNAAEVAALGADLHKRFTKFLEHFGKIGKGLSSAFASYEDAVGSMNRMVLPAARKFTALHSGNQSIADLPLSDKTPRLIAIEDDEDTNKVSHG
jgi:DNA recombination protein RmuC